MLEVTEWRLMNLAERFLIYAMVHKLSSVEHEIRIFLV